jgi:hypothetical protein
MKKKTDKDAIELTPHNLYMDNAWIFPNKEAHDKFMQSLLKDKTTDQSLEADRAEEIIEQEGQDT